MKSQPKIEEIEHKERGGFDPILTAFTACAGIFTAFTPKRHTVVVRDNHNVYAVGIGETHTKARNQATENLSPDKR
jgi:hypothetical protein